MRKIRDWANTPKPPTPPYWAPVEPQWWITGFRPDFDEPDVTKMTLLGTIDFEGRSDMFNDLKSKTEAETELKDFMIFDTDGHTVWLIWWGDKNNIEE